MASRILLGFAVCWIGWLLDGFQPAVAQDASEDTTGISIQLSPDSSANSPLLPFETEPYAVGIPIDSVLPAKRFYLDLTRSLSLNSGGFGYDLGNVGWPHQWSVDGLDPESVELTVDGIAQRDPSTNRALFDALPIDLLQAPRTTPFAHGGPRLVETHIRPLDERRPYTELRYMTGAGGLQSISGAHVQQRQWHILGAPTVTQFVVRLAFHEWSGRYPNSGSDLSQVFGRIGFTSRRWKIRFSNSYSLRTRGAHSGVIPAGSDFDSVYETLNARVGDPGAEQRHQRNQFDVSVEHTWESGLRPLVIRSSFTKSLYRYTNVDTAETRSSEFRLRVEQSAPEFVSGHQFTGRMSFENTSLQSDGLLNAGGGGTKGRFLMTIDDRFEVAGFDVLAAVGINTVREFTYPSASIDLMHRFGGGFLGVTASINGLAPSELEIVGGLGVVEADARVSSSVTRNYRLSGGLAGSSLEAEIAVFLSEHVDPVEIVRVDDGAHRVIQMSGTQRVVGASGMLGWRTRSHKGLYGSVSPTIRNMVGRFNVPVSTSEIGIFPADQLNSVLPAFSGNARFGLRSLLFEGDLDLDIYLLGRFWSRFTGRAYDPVHAILVLPEADSRPVDASGTLDIKLEAGIREATLWVSVDNFLAGWMYPGAMTVPVYPYLSAAFRFGVFWPISG